MPGRYWPCSTNGHTSAAAGAAHPVDRSLSDADGPDSSRPVRESRSASRPCRLGDQSADSRQEVRKPTNGLDGAGNMRFGKPSAEHEQSGLTKDRTTTVYWPRRLVRRKSARRPQTVSGSQRSNGVSAQVSALCQRWPTVAAYAGLLPAKVHGDTAEVVRVLLHAVIQRFDLLLIEEAQHVLLQGT